MIYTSDNCKSFTLVLFFNHKKIDIIKKKLQKHNFLSFDNYLPNVANFFKEKQEFVQGIRDEVITYVLQKYVSIFLILLILK